MNAQGYALSPVIWDAADCGVPQHRQRILIAATRSKHSIDLAAPSAAHRPIRDVIDFGAGSWSPIERPGRSPKTLARVRAGRRQYGDRFVMPDYGSGSGLTGWSLDRPVGTISTRVRWALVDGNRMRMLTTAENCVGMGFPADYILPDNHALALHMLGNANPPPLAAYAIEAMRKAA